MGPVAAQGAQVVGAELELRGLEQLVGALLGREVPLELEEEQVGLDRGAELAGALHQRTALRVGRVEREAQHRVGAGAAGQVVDRGQLVHRRGEPVGVELGHRAAVALGEGRGALARLAEHLLHALGTAAADERLEVPGRALQGVVGAHGGIRHWRQYVGMDTPTPLEEAPAGLGDGPLYLKREDVHELGAFKWRGALPALELYRSRGADAVVTASTGNHGAASAWAAERLDLRAVVFAPEDASRTKLALLERLGAELQLVGEDLDAAKELGRAWAAEHGLPFFEDGAEPAQFEGYAAIGRELLAQLGDAAGARAGAVGNGALLIGVARAVGSAAR